ncbi:TetR/AcrR family transcriptional regulator [Pseudonocardia humida]|uniref:TetR/AcrR family transcriptional regulator n=1 Tax=Pseudonocardia humida TaxID=2800819 RepID=A0ABT0ZSR8_9PSEU|nr:TetR family transcriptional regulator [Pseudonocardia humida]MCO1653761.1 TetR/AcrR family transcriptional regulator [Pseudonocardia humida]
MPRLDETNRPARWAGVPAADRVAERRALLLDAGLELLGTLGLAGTTVRGVCAAARLNARYFYESFPDIDALVVAVFDRVVEELREAGDAAVRAAGTDPVARVRALVATTAEFVDTDRRRARVLYVEGRAHEQLLHRRLESGSLIAGLIATETGGEEPGVAHRVVAAFLVGGFSELLMRWLDGEIPVERDRLVRDTTELFLALGRAGARLANP